jgi:hypothetical protein
LQVYIRNNRPRDVPPHRHVCQAYRHVV